ncbi:hypothetical protein DNTS_009710, partial [Danionella cerebrum]
AGFDTINSRNSFVIPESTNGNYQNLKNTSNVNVPGRWAFDAWGAPGIFYPFGSEVGDSVYREFGYSLVGLSAPFSFFGRSHRQIYVNYNGLLTFNMEVLSAPSYYPIRGTEDLIAGLWNDFDDGYRMVFWYQEYTNGSVLTRATQDINYHFSANNFQASWVFVVTWMYDLNLHPKVMFQAGYDTMGSTNSFQFATSMNYQNLKNTSNIDVPGRWAFNCSQKLELPDYTTLETTTEPTSTTPETTPVPPETTTTTTTPSSANGDTQHFLNDGEDPYSVGLSTPFTFFGTSYGILYVSYNGVITFSKPAISGFNYIPTKGAEDFIAGLWRKYNGSDAGLFTYQQWTNGNVLSRASGDINHYFNSSNFQASWVLVVTWQYGPQENPSTLFQVVLISDGFQSFFFINYGDCDGLYQEIEAGFDTINSRNSFVIPESTNGNYQNLKNTSNVNVPGRWAFDAWGAPGIFYPFGSEVGDSVYREFGYSLVGLSAPFSFFGRSHRQIYVNYNGLLTFNMEVLSAPSYYPIRGAEDLIAGLWNDFDDGYRMVFWYQEYTNGSVLTRATQDINYHFSANNFQASWVFVVTWMYDLNLHPKVMFQAGYDTMGSTNSFQFATSMNYQNLKNTSNIDVPGRWAFNCSQKLETTTTTTTPSTAPEVFYPFGSAAGDSFELSGDTYRDVEFSTPFTFFGRKYNHIYVNNNGLLTFNQPLPEAGPFSFPTHGNEDYIAALWTELDDLGVGKYSFQQYTDGNVLLRATQDINQYFPDIGFVASWVFVATWDYGITVQAVLISGSEFSFILMNYGDCAEMNFAVQAGFDTVDSSEFYVILYENNGQSIPTLKTRSNVDVPGRWAFLVNNGTENVLGLQLRIKSFSDLTQRENIENFLQLIKQELVSHGSSSHFVLKLRKVKQIQP